MHRHYCSITDLQDAFCCDTDCDAPCPSCPNTVKPKSRLNPSISITSAQGSDTLAYVNGIGWSWMVDNCGIYTTPEIYKIVRDELDHAGHNAIVGNRWRTCIR